MMVIIGGGGASGPSLSPKNDGKKGCKPMISVPVNALVSSDESGEGVSPEVGDNITLSNVEAVVKSIKDGQAEVEILAINGEAAEYVGKKDANQERDELLEEAMESDKEAGYEE